MFSAALALLLSASAAPLEDGVPLLSLAAPDPAAQIGEDEARRRAGLPPRFAVPVEVAIGPATHGRWEDVGERWRRWRYRVRAPGAASLNFGFTRFDLPPGARLTLRAPGAPRALLVLEHGAASRGAQRWTPILPADDLVIELAVPAGVLGQVQLELGAIGLGYRPPESGACNVDVACEEGDPWREAIAAVGMYSLEGWYTCSGALINNTTGDGRPLFLTAEHCGVTADNAASMVVYWGYESPTCGRRGGGRLDQYQAGARLLASDRRSDFTLVELDERPAEAYEVSYAGWDRSGLDATLAVGIHHPGLEEKAISLSYSGAVLTSYGSFTSPGDGTHLVVDGWDVGTTEEGSSGSPLFNQDGRIIGQLHGGGASCSSDQADWYGALAASWSGGGDSGSRLSDWLDPAGTGALYTDTLAPWSAGLLVTGGAFVAGGPEGGPIRPAAARWELRSQRAAPLVFQASSSATWLELEPEEGVLAPGGSAALVAALSDGAAALPTGRYDDVVLIATAGEEAVEIPARLVIRAPGAASEDEPEPPGGCGCGGGLGAGAASLGALLAVLGRRQSVLDFCRG